VAGRSQIPQNVATVAVENDGTRRHGEDQVAALPAVAVGALAGGALLGVPVFAVDDLGQAVGAGDGAEEDVAAVAAVAAVGAALGDVLLPPETEAAPPAVAAFDKNGDPIHEHRACRSAGDKVRSETLTHYRQRRCAARRAGSVR